VKMSIFDYFRGHKSGNMGQSQTKSRRCTTSHHDNDLRKVSSIYVKYCFS
jgi:hypothetical protein